MCIVDPTQNTNDQEKDTGNAKIILKCGFCKKLLLYECNSDQWPTFFFHHFRVDATAKQQQIHPKVMTERKKCTAIPNREVQGFTGKSL
jgi:hypothetical protein